MGQRLIPLVAVGLVLALVGVGCPSKKKVGEGEGGIAGLGSEEGLAGAGSLERHGAGLAPGAEGPLKDIQFAFDSFELDEAARQALRENHDWLKDNAKAKVEIEGHCDERGTVEYNLALGAKRARAAKDYLATLGVSSDRLTTISYGEELPICRDHDDACWERNRRVHFVVLAE
ncbi:MAG: peptidoglycan-associated lipoprotein Pal [Deltaproteobacteria bacterium]|nr:peptidoglycan-associated lipoprotein Pal [Deltaproteobacteria bacterium]